MKNIITNVAITHHTDERIRALAMKNFITNLAITHHTDERIRALAMKNVKLTLPLHTTPTKQLEHSR